ncbi:uncharacterized protein LOC129962104 [Argiope bruennichi]|uniref:uncharacterized protein LOC129962104 n=1 Tax=Argiope bruennichi TaxID=94029 RepID=UPI00249408CC|nr:uncharacterized protein LOC129962104 [Argiope bruennichi]
MWCFIFLSAIIIAPALSEENCDVSRYVACMEPIHNATFGHPNGLFQDSNDLATSCPIIKNGIKCIQDYASQCGTDMIAENFHEQFERPAEFLTKICDSSSPIRNDYLKASPCLHEKSDDLEVCSTKVQEFLAILDEPDTNEKELTLTCMYEMMLRACLMSTSAEKCGLETAVFIRKALLYSPSLGMQTCSKEVQSHMLITEMVTVAPREKSTQEKLDDVINNCPMTNPVPCLDKIFKLNKQLMSEISRRQTGTD